LNGIEQIDQIRTVDRLDREITEARKDAAFELRPRERAAVLPTETASVREHARLGCKGSRVRIPPPRPIESTP
jgi:hypothetical protein